LCKANIVEVIEAINGIPKCFVIFLLDKQVIVGVINSLDVELVVKVHIKNNDECIEGAHVAQQ
jgi:hypothetical protein